MMFVIVSFDETCEVDFVPVNWIADGTKVSDFSRLIQSRSAVKFYWPPTRSATSLSKAQAAGTEPEVHWATCWGRILGSAGRKTYFHKFCVDESKRKDVTSRSDYRK